MTGSMGPKIKGQTGGSTTPPTSPPKSRGSVSEVGLPELAVAVGLVRPPRGVVLWDESKASQNRLIRDDHKVRRGSQISAVNPAKKEVRGDRHWNMA